MNDHTEIAQLRYQASHSEHGSHFHAENERRLRAELATAREKLSAVDSSMKATLEFLNSELTQAREERAEFSDAGQYWKSVAESRLTESDRLGAELATAREELNTALWLHAESEWFRNICLRSANQWADDFHEHLRTLRRKIMAGYVDTEELTGFPALFEALRPLLAEGAAARAAQPGTVAELTELLVAASSEWDDNTGDDETSRPYLEHLAKAIESWRPVPAEAAEPEGQNR